MPAITTPAKAKAAVLALGAAWPAERRFVDYHTQQPGLWFRVYPPTAPGVLPVSALRMVYRVRGAGGSAREVVLVRIEPVDLDDRALMLTKMNEAEAAFVRAKGEARNGTDPFPRGRQTSAAQAASAAAAVAAFEAEAPAPVPNNGPTVAEVVEKFLGEYRGRRRNGQPMRKSSADTYKRNLKRLIAACGDVPARQLCRDQALGPAFALERAAEPMMAAADSYSRSVQTFVGWCARLRLVDPNLPLEIEIRGAVTRRDRVLDDDELAVVLTAAGRMPYPWKHLALGLAYSGLRREEWAHLPPTELQLTPLPDAPSGRAVIRADRMKGSLEYELVLTPRLRALIDDALASRPSAHPYVMAGRERADGDGGERRMVPISGYNGFKEALDRECIAVRVERAGFTLNPRPHERTRQLDDFAAGYGLAPWTLHDLRRTLRTRLGELGIDDAIAERVLAHAQDAMGRTYNHARHRRAKLDALKRLDTHYQEVVRAWAEPIAA